MQTMLSHFRFFCKVKYELLSICSVFVGVGGHYRSLSSPPFQSLCGGFIITAGGSGGVRVPDLWSFLSANAIGRLVSSELVISAGWTKGGINPAQPLCVKYPSKAVSPDAALSLWTLKGFTVLQTNTFIFPALFCLTSRLRTVQCHLSLRHTRGAAMHKTSLKQRYVFLAFWRSCGCLKDKQETMNEVEVNKHCLLLN